MYECGYGRVSKEERAVGGWALELLRLHVMANSRPSKFTAH